MSEKKTNSLREIYSPVNLLNGLATLFTGMRSRMAANYRMFFMTSMMMVPAATAGMIGSVVSLLATISSVLWGFIMQKSNPQMGRIRFWVLVGGMACGICTFLSFVDFHLSAPLTTIYLIVFCSGMDVFYNAYYPASMGVISLLADTTQKRTNMTAVRNTFNSLSKYHLRRCECGHHRLGRQSVWERDCRLHHAGTSHRCADLHRFADPFHFPEGEGTA